MGTYDSFWNLIEKEASRDTTDGDDRPWHENEKYDYVICTKCHGDVPRDSVDENGVCKWHTESEMPQ